MKTKILLRLRVVYIIGICIFVCGGLLFMQRKSINDRSVNPQDDELSIPWNDENAKQPEEYTWEEFNKLQKVQQEIFIDSFEGDLSFDDWLLREDPQLKLDIAPWTLEGGKKPEEYTWDEFNKLSEINQMKFVDYMDEREGFENWYNDNYKE